MKKRGISLIVLVITIIVIVILGTAAIVTFVKNNPIENAKNATKKWNKKTLEEKVNMLETELLLEFQEAGLGGMILPSYAKEVYMDALKEGKTEEEAKQLAKDSFIGDSAHWTWTKGRLVKASADAIEYDPIYKEVMRVLCLIDDSYDEWVELDTDTSIVPEDLVKNLEEYHDVAYAYYTDEITTAEYDAEVLKIQPLWGMTMALDENNKYYDLHHATLRIPYYFYLDAEKTKIAKLEDYSVNKNELIPLVEEYKYTVIIEEGYTTFTLKGVPHCGNLILPDTIKRIECTALTRYGEKIIIPSSVEYINKNAFYHPLDMGELKEVIVKKEEGSIPGAPWGANTSVVTITWDPE